MKLTAYCCFLDESAVEGGDMQQILLDCESQQLVKDWMPRNAVVSELSDFFFAFSDATRTKIVCALSISEMCVGDLATLLSINQTTCSHQLRLLKSADVVSDRRDGKVVYYRIKNKKIEDVLLAGVECVVG